MIQLMRWPAMNLIPHITVLRRLSLEFVVLWLGLFVMVYWQHPGLMAIFLKSFIGFLPHQPVLLANHILAPLSIPLEFSLDLSLMLSLPGLFIQIWRFIKPALYRNERSMLCILVSLSLSLLILGILFAWYWVLPFGMHLLTQHVPNNLLWLPSWSSLYHFVVWTLIFFGLAFQLPLIMCCGHYFGIFAYDRWQQLRRGWVVMAFIIGMIVTPPDVLSQLMVAIPLCLLYELGLLMIRFFGSSAASVGNNEQH